MILCIVVASLFSALVIALAGCPNFSDLQGGLPDDGAASSNDSGADTSVDSGATVDATPDSGGLVPDAACDVDGVFDPPLLVPGSINSAAGDYGARLSRDELTIHFASLRNAGNGADIFTATRSSTAAPFGPATVVAQLQSGFTDDFPSLSANGLALFFGRYNANGDVFSARRDASTEFFGNITQLPVPINSSADDLQPFLADNGDLYMASSRRTATSFDLFRAPLLGDGGFGTPEALEELTTPFLDATPVLSFDLKTIYFSSERKDDGGDGSLEIWMAHRNVPSGPFGSPRRVPELNVAGKLDQPSWLSADACRLYMTSQRTNTLQIYMAMRRP